MTLVLIGTPIGNLGDLSPRAVQALAAADAICCEDTRRTGRLLQHAGVERRPLVVVNDHSEDAAVAKVLARLDRGERVAVVSDAGMPGISDPGERLVQAALAAGHAVEVVPGPSAAVTAMVVSGLPAGRFVFEGFLPRKGSGRTARLAEVAAERRTALLYEAPHRLLRTLADLLDACGPDRPVAVARELTKLHEETWRGTLAAAAAWAADHPPKGEIVLVLGGAPALQPAADDDVEQAVRERLDAGDSVRDAAAAVASDLRVPRRRAYAIAQRSVDATRQGTRNRSSGSSGA
ncbi:MAG: 16S rRNA (cytidine(1402)-2'-O)-methyltransferase [Acidimicrobiales bacterium]|nr:16S rRNA (cytidine(1402)-2'-O)-methyltransferase [Acidimicrobiales bacterium]